MQQLFQHSKFTNCVSTTDNMLLTPQFFFLTTASSICSIIFQYLFFFLIFFILVSPFFFLRCFPRDRDTFYNLATMLNSTSLQLPFNDNIPSKKYPLQTTFQTEETNDEKKSL